MAWGSLGRRRRGVWAAAGAHAVNGDLPGVSLSTAARDHRQCPIGEWRGRTGCICPSCGSDDRRNAMQSWADDPLLRDGHGWYVHPLGWRAWLSEHARKRDRGGDQPSLRLSGRRDTTSDGHPYADPGSTTSGSAGPPNKGMKLTKLRAAPVWQAEVPPCARSVQSGAGTASQLIPGVRWT